MTEALTDPTILATLSPEMALRFEKAFDIRMDLLMRMQVWHDIARM